MLSAEQPPLEKSSIRDETLQLLSNAAINIFPWGTATGTQSPNSLINEILAGESEIETIDGKLERKVRILGINVYYQQDDRWLRLVEVSPHHGAGRRRIRRFSPSMPETLVDRETAAEDALYGVLHEQLGITRESVAAWEHVRNVERRRESNSFPGLYTRDQLRHYWVELDQSGYQPEGYVHMSPGNSPRFVWVFND